jgi:hypothetical protein
MQLDGIMGKVTLKLLRGEAASIPELTRGRDAIQLICP